jgi:hypothetical protein
VSAGATTRADDDTPERIIKFPVEVRKIRFGAESRSIEFAESRAIEF